MGRLLRCTFKRTTTGSLWAPGRYVVPQLSATEAFSSAMAALLKAVGYKLLLSISMPRNCHDADAKIP